MEEDIKTLEELLKASKENDMYEGNKYFKSLEYFIKEYQDLKEIEASHRKENGELRERVKELEEENQLLLNSKIGVDLSFDDYIPVSLVEETIGEIQKEYEETLKTANFKEIEKMNNINFRGITLEGQRSILRELLEKR